MKRATKRPAGGNLGIFRHFAVGTLVLTGVLAMFASGNDAQVQASQAAETKPGPDKVDLAVSGKGSNSIQTAEHHSWTYVDSMGQGDNMVANVSGGGNLGGSFNSYIDSASGRAGAVSQEVAHQIAMASAADADPKRRRPGAKAETAAPPSADEIAQMLAQSRARSGSGEGR
ncbi:hypothetical protein ACFSTD_11635 [Novosphingobium colocasiae]|uniref:Uncharacterized protein n=2 Tax=Bacteria TaxID=2 RepID=A0A918UEC5_9SPHN|nr:hypothetical protein [Novosphingobium colocasiae]GGY96901.1 hypothetical protein GCM10011614_09810 [Novosphingobium colocasiae]